MKAICAKFNLDAVAVVDVDLAYESGTFSVGGNESAALYVASSPRVINSKGEYAISEFKPR